MTFPQPHPDSIIFDSDQLYACLASEAVAAGHVIVVWKADVADLGELSKGDYDLLMETVDAVRSAMLKVLNIEKVYLVYMDEAKHVHWHLVPRYDEKGFNVFHHEPKQVTDFSLVLKIKEKISNR